MEGCMEELHQMQFKAEAELFAEYLFCTGCWLAHKYHHSGKHANKHSITRTIGA